MSKVFSNELQRRILDGLRIEYYRKRRRTEVDYPEIQKLRHPYFVLTTQTDPVLWDASRIRFCFSYDFVRSHMQKWGEMRDILYRAMAI